jgi:hypothetical protein
MYTTVPFFHLFGKNRVNRKCDFEAVSGRKNTELCATLNLESMWILPFLHATAGHHGVHAAAAGAADDDVTGMFVVSLSTVYADVDRSASILYQPRIGVVFRSSSSRPRKAVTPTITFENILGAQILGTADTAGLDSMRHR